MARLIFFISLTSSERYGVIGIASSPDMDDFTVCWMSPLEKVSSLKV